MNLATQSILKPGDFTALASDYARYRPGYSESALTALLCLIGKPLSAIDAVDVGAGTGIFTRMLAARNLHSVTAVEPNEAMRKWGALTSEGLAINWRTGSGEATGLESHSADFVSMASSFHWVDFDKACAEFQRILRPGGRFAAIWNPRLIEINPLLVEIEREIARLKPDIRRVSSGRSGITETLTDRLWMNSRFDDVLYIEGRHVLRQTPEQYLGAWRSVNDLQSQLGPDLFGRFLRFVDARVAGLPAIETTYLTRAWTALRP